MTRSPNPAQVYVLRTAQNAWVGEGRTRPLVVPGFPTFTSLDVFNGLAVPTGSLDAGTRNVGCRIPDAKLTVVAGDHVGANGVTYRGLDIQGQVTTAATTDKAFYIDCKIRGKNKPTSQNAMAVGHNFNFGGTTFTYCTFDGSGRESMWMDCINGGNWVLNYCELMRGVDGLGANAVGKGVAYCCRVYHGHYQAFWNTAAGAVRSSTYTDAGGATFSPPFIAQSSGDTHSDGCQIQGQSGWSIKGCYFGGPRGSTSSFTHLDPTVSADYAVQQARDADSSYVNSALIINAISANPVGALIQHNILHGGAARLNMSISGSDLLAGVTVTDNLFVRDSYGFYIYAQTGNAATFSNNLYSDTRAPVPVVNW